jgi:hypothetical protein
VVEDYALPPYEAIVSIPEVTPYADGSVPVQITATYSFGDPVSGTGTFSVMYNGNTIITRQVQFVNGVASFSLTVTDLQALADSNNYYSYTFAMTDSTLNSPLTLDGYFEVVPYNFIIEVTGETFFLPGAPYIYSVFVKDLDGTPAPAGKYVYVTILPMNVEQLLVLDSNGKASSTFNAPTNATRYLSFEFNSKYAQTAWWYAYAPWNGQSSIIALNTSPAR